MKPAPDILPPTIDRGPLAGIPPTLEWVGGRDGVLRLLDQTQLPTRAQMLDCTTAEQVWEAIRVLRVRGAPAIGVAAAYGLCLGTRASRGLPREKFSAHARTIADYLRSSRPTAVNLGWALARVLDKMSACTASDSAQLWDALLTEAHLIAAEDAAHCRAIGLAGAELIPAAGGVLTHCNAGALATVAYGTALALMYVAHARGRRFRVYVNETRPLLQGARLTVWELSHAGLDVTLLCDGAAASLMQAGHVQLVVVGADHIAANGDTANKIGTYGLALAAQRHGIPFYVAAPLCTIDRSLPSGAAIPIEWRPEEEVRGAPSQPSAPPLVRCYNPAFDVTPAGLIAGIVTEKGIIKPVNKDQIELVFAPRSTACGPASGA